MRMSRRVDPDNLILRQEYPAVRAARSRASHMDWSSSSFTDPDGAGSPDMTTSEYFGQPANGMTQLWHNLSHECAAISSALSHNGMRKSASPMARARCMN